MTSASRFWQRLSFYFAILNSTGLFATCSGILFLCPQMILKYKFWNYIFVVASLIGSSLLLFWRPGAIDLFVDVKNPTKRLPFGREASRRIFLGLAVVSSLAAVIFWTSEVFLMDRRLRKCPVAHSQSAVDAEKQTAKK
jgi:hypothetical protein